MALDVHFTHDVAQSITSTAVAMLSSAAAHGGGNVEYCRGVVDFARAQCVRFGVDWQTVHAQLRAAMVEGHGLVEEMVRGQLEG